MNTFWHINHQNPLIHTWTRLIKALPYQLHSNGLQQQELTETSNSALYDTASNEQGTKCFLRWNSSWGWLAGRATGHRPTLRKWEKPLWGWSSRHWVRIKQKTAEGFFFFTTSVELPNHLTFFFFLHRDDRKLGVFGLGTREWRLPRLHNLWLQCRPGPGLWLAVGINTSPAKEEQLNVLTVNLKNLFFPSPFCKICQQEALSL